MYSVGQNQGADKSELGAVLSRWLSCYFMLWVVFCSLGMPGTDLSLDASKMSSPRLCPVANISGVGVKVIH